MSQLGLLFTTIVGLGAWQWGHCLPNGFRAQIKNEKTQHDLAMKDSISVRHFHSFRVAYQLAVSVFLIVVKPYQSTLLTLVVLSPTFNFVESLLADDGNH